MQTNKSLTNLYQKNKKRNLNRKLNKVWHNGYAMSAQNNLRLEILYSNT